MIRINVIGSGNVAHHLIRALLQLEKSQPQWQLQQVMARRAKQLPHELPAEKHIDDIALWKTADLCLVAVSDDAITAVTEQIKQEDLLVAHTSGSQPMKAIATGLRRAVFYPLQTFSIQKPVDFKTVPLCLEAETQSDLALLKSLAMALSEKVYNIDSQQRKALHVAAVFACNFVNHMYHLSAEICEQEKVPFEVLLPLIEETAAKVKALHPADAQTGPARRNDKKTLKAHVDFLQDEKKRDLYQLLTHSIQEHVKKL